MAPRGNVASDPLAVAMVKVLRGEGALVPESAAQALSKAPSWYQVYAVACPECHAPALFYCKFDARLRLCDFRGELQRRIEREAAEADQD